jgi:uncharacterized protein with LGFP repeats
MKDVILIYKQIRKNGKCVGWQTTINGKTFKALTMKTLRQIAHRELLVDGPYVLIQD